MTASEFSADFSHAIPVMPSRDVQSSIDFFKGLGAHKDFITEDKTYGGVHFGRTELHFFLASEDILFLWFSCRIQMFSVKNAYEMCKERGVLHPNGDLATKDYGYLEFSILDPFGVLYTFAEYIGEKSSN